MTSWERLFRLFYLREILEEKVRSARLHGLKAYVQTVRRARISLAAAVMLLFATFLTAMGAIALVAGVFLLLPLSPEARLWTLVGMGAVFFFGPALTAVLLLREKVWLEKSGIQELIAKELDLMEPQSFADTPPAPSVLEASSDSLANLMASEDEFLAEPAPEASSEPIDRIEA